MEKKLRTSTLHEVVRLTEAELDEDARTVKGATIIVPGWSANGRYYPPGVLADAVPLFEGAKAYADHPSKADLKARPERSIHDLAGWYENVRIDDAGRMRGELIVEDARIWSKVQAAVTRNPNYLGISINAVGYTVKGEAEGKKGIVVESITHATSGDIVTSPAAGGGFDNLMASDDGMVTAILENVSLDEVRQTRPDLIKALQREWKTPRDSNALIEAKKRNKELAEQNRTDRERLVELGQRLEGLRKEVDVDRLLANRHLPDAWKAQLRAELLNAEISKWPSIVEAEMAKVQTVKPRVTVTGAGRPAAPAPLSAKPASPRNPVANLLGVALDESAPHPDEPFHEWQRRVGQVTGD